MLNICHFIQVFVNHHFNVHISGLCFRPNFAVMLIIESEEILSAHFLNYLIRLLETLYDVFLGRTDMHIIGDYRFDHLRPSYILLVSENK